MKRTTLKYLLIALVLFYFIFPRDLIPDIFGWLGRIDDLLLGIYIYYQFKKREKRWKNVSHGQEEPKRETHQESNTTPPPRDPYTILGLSPGASKKEIREAYRKFAAEYHPDKVSHLGEDLRTLAHDKMIEIQRAYDELGGG